MLVLGLTTSGFATVVYNITQISLRQAITPARLQGRMNAAMRWVVWGTIPLGSIVGGLVAQASGMRSALWVGAAGSLLAILPVALGSVRRVGAMPAPPGGAGLGAPGRPWPPRPAALLGHTRAD